MARFSIYVSDKELQWIKEQEPGKVRDLVKEAMYSLEEPLSPEGVWNGHCPDCGEKLNRKGQPHGCKGKP